MGRVQCGMAIVWVLLGDGGVAMALALWVRACVLNPLGGFRPMGGFLFRFVLQFGLARQLGERSVGFIISMWIPIGCQPSRIEIHCYQARAFRRQRVSASMSEIRVEIANGCGACG